MQLPAYWWLLALTTLIQGAFFVGLYIVRMRRKEVRPPSRKTMGLLFGAGGAGLVYGVVQSDPLFFVGQGCLLLMYYRMHTNGHE